MNISLITADMFLANSWFMEATFGDSFEFLSFICVKSSKFCQISRPQSQVTKRMGGHSVQPYSV